MTRRYFAVPRPWNAICGQKDRIRLFRATTTPKTLSSICRGGRVRGHCERQKLLCTIYRQVASPTSGMATVPPCTPLRWHTDKLARRRFDVPDCCWGRYARFPSRLSAEAQRSHICIPIDHAENWSLQHRNRFRVSVHLCNNMAWLGQLQNPAVGCGVRPGHIPEMLSGM